MKNTFGNNLSVTIFGESHGEEIGAVADGFAPGIPVDSDYIDRMLAMRRPCGDISTARCEKDNYRIISGVFNGYTTGTPLCVTIPNENVCSADYEKNKCLARPGHADFTANEKYHGFQDYRGGGHFSGRLTAPLVAVGAVARQALEKKNIFIGTHILSVADISDSVFDYTYPEIKSLKEKSFPVLNEEAGERMKAKIRNAASSKDSVGGILETAVTGIPAGVGEPWFDSVESMLSHGLFSIPGVKGVEFGAGFEFGRMSGSEANDPFFADGKTIKTKTNNNGGVNGGITNGMPVVFRVAVKPTPSIGIKQDTVDLTTCTDAQIETEGRHDPCIVHRVRAVAEAVTAIVIYDLLSGRYGTDYFYGD